MRQLDTNERVGIALIGAVIAFFAALKLNLMSLPMAFALDDVLNGLGNQWGMLNGTVQSVLFATMIGVLILLVLSPKK